jgi:hypothetical protein
MAPCSHAYCNYSKFYIKTLQLYIVYMGEKKHDDPSMVTASHHDVLASVLGRYDVPVVQAAMSASSSQHICRKNDCSHSIAFDLVVHGNSTDENQKSIVYTYKHGFSGFAAMLTESQAKIIASNNQINTEGSF